MSVSTEAALLGLLNEHQSLGNGKARELLGLDEAAYESLKIELLAKGLIATGRGRGGSIRLADPAISRADDQLMKSRNAAEPKAKKPMATAPEPKAKGQEPNTAQDEQAFLNELDKKLWTAACKLQASLDAAVYKHAVLGLIFLKYVSDSFEMRQQEVERELRDPKSDLYLDPKEYDGAASKGYLEAIHAELEERDYYTAKNVFWVPALARWKTLQDNAKLPSGTKINVPSTHGSTYTLTSLGKFIDDALDAVEKENPKLKGVLNKTYAQLQIEQSNLSSLIDLIATIPFNHPGSGPGQALHAKDILGHVYEYFLGQFALAEGKKGGQYYTPKSIVSLIVRMLQPYKGRIYDPAMGSGGFFVQSAEFVDAAADTNSRRDDARVAHYEDAAVGKFPISVYGQESNPTTWRLAAMNMAIRGIDFNFGKEPANSFTNDQHPDLRADFVMANPPFNVKEWWDAKLEGDPRWQYGTPPQGNANFAWVQHMLYHLAPKGSMALLLSNGSMSSNSGGEGDIRKALLEADLVECMVALPGQLFTNTQIPACIWFLTKDKRGGVIPGPDPESRFAKRNRKGEVLFIDARKLGYMKDRVLRDFTAEDIERITMAYHSWQCDLQQGEVDMGNGIVAQVDPDPDYLYMDQPGFCFSATLEEIAKHDFVLTPGRYVGAEESEDDTEAFGLKMTRLIEDLNGQFGESDRLQGVIKSNLAAFGYEA